MLMEGLPKYISI